MVGDSDPVVAEIVCGFGDFDDFVGVQKGRLI